MYIGKVLDIWEARRYETIIRKSIERNTWSPLNSKIFYIYIYILLDTYIQDYMKINAWEVDIQIRNDDFSFGSVFIKKSNQIEFFFLKKLKLVQTDQFRFGFFYKTSLTWFFRFWLGFFRSGFDSFSFFSFRLIKPNRTGRFFKILIGFFTV
jgi:hypothetical protein